MVNVLMKLCAAAALAVYAITPAGCTPQTAAEAAEQWDTGEHWTWGDNAEVLERIGVIDDVKNAVRRQNFANLDALEAQFRNSDATSSQSASKLSLYFDQLVFELGQIGRSEASGKCDAGWEPFVDKWQMASPRAPGPIIVRAAMLESRGWCYRGEDVAGNVPANAWKPFHDNIEAAATLLQKNKAIAAVDPEYYAALAGLARVRATSRAEFRALLDEASARFPYYYRIYYAAYPYFQPQWNGSYEEIDQFARYVVDRTKARDGMSGYFRLYFHMAICRCFRDMQPMDWPTMQTAMADLAVRYPLDWAYMRAAQMACVRGQGEDALTYLAKIKINDARFWTKKDWDQCRTLVGPSKYPFPL